jgi:hypothetical protein
MRAFISALGGAPKTYAEIFAGIDPRQIVVVTGEEDNEFQPGMLTSRSVGSDAGASPTPSSSQDRQDRQDPADARSSSSCSAATNGGTSSRLDLVAVAILAAAVERRRRRRGRSLSHRT